MRAFCIGQAQADEARITEFLKRAVQLRKFPALAMRAVENYRQRLLLWFCGKMLQSGDNDSLEMVTLVAKIMLL